VRKTPDQIPSCSYTVSNTKSERTYNPDQSRRYLSRLKLGHATDVREHMLQDAKFMSDIAPLSASDLLKHLN